MATRELASFIDDRQITSTLARAERPARRVVDRILAKAALAQGLRSEEVATLLMVEEPRMLEEIFHTALSVKHRIYGDRTVMFAPLYISNYCVNSCTYCGYSHKSASPRRRLNQEELAEEVRTLESMGHKRLALSRPMGWTCPHSRTWSLTRSSRNWWLYWSSLRITPPPLPAKSASGPLRATSGGFRTRKRRKSPGSGWRGSRTESVICTYERQPPATRREVFRS